MFRSLLHATLAVAIASGSTIASGTADAEDLVATDVEKLQGSWVLVYWLAAGKEYSVSKEKTVLSFVGEKFTISVDERVTEKGVFQAIDSDVSPKRFDYLPTEVEGTPRTSTYPAIYLLQDDLFIACVGYEGKRPKAFSAENTSSNELVIYKRVKK